MMHNFVKIYRENVNSSLTFYFGVSFIIMYYSYIPGDIVGTTTFKLTAGLDGKTAVRNIHEHHVERNGIRYIITENEQIIDLIKNLDCPTIKLNERIYANTRQFHRVGLDTHLTAFRYCIPGYATLQHIASKKMPKIKRCGEMSIFNDCIDEETKNVTISAIIEELNLRQPTNLCESIAYIYLIVKEIQKLATIVDDNRFEKMANKVFVHPTLTLSGYIEENDISLDPVIPLISPFNYDVHSIIYLISNPTAAVLTKNPRSFRDSFCIVVKSLPENERKTFIQECSRIILSVNSTITNCFWKKSQQAAKTNKDKMYAFIDNMHPGRHNFTYIPAKEPCDEIIKEINTFVDNHKI